MNHIRMHAIAAMTMFPHCPEPMAMFEYYDEDYDDDDQPSRNFTIDEVNWEARQHNVRGYLVGRYEEYDDGYSFLIEFSAVMTGGREPIIGLWENARKETVRGQVMEFSRTPMYGRPGWLRRDQNPTPSGARHWYGGLYFNLLS